MLGLTESYTQFNSFKKQPNPWDMIVYGHMD